MKLNYLSHFLKPDLSMPNTKHRDDYADDRCYGVT